MVMITEHGFLDEQLEEIDLTNESDKERFLGLYLDWNNANKKFEPRASYYIGSCWIKANAPALHVRPKVEKLNYLKIFSECLSNPVVAKHFNKAYKIFFDEPLIEVEESKKIDITLLLIVHFLTIAKRIGQKGLKKGYVKVSESLTGKIKGKINVQQNIRKNLSVNRADRVFCTYQIHTQDCLENRLIKTALKRVSAYLYRHVEKDKGNEDLFKLLKFDQFSFDAITEINVSLNDFKTIKHSAFYSEYKEALRLAEMIFKRLGFNPQQNEDEQAKTPPFYIDMPELFERYVEVQLRKNHADVLAGYAKDGDSETESTWGLRPDFLVPSLTMIVDAKYKQWFEADNSDKLKVDYQQLALYGRASNILEMIGAKSSTARLVFVHPTDDKTANEIDLSKIGNSVRGFEHIYKIGINLPLS